MNNSDFAKLASKYGFKKEYNNWFSLNGYRLFHFNNKIKKDSTLEFMAYNLSEESLKEILQILSREYKK